MDVVPTQLAPFVARLEALYGTRDCQRIVRTMIEPKRTGCWLNPLRIQSTVEIGEPQPGMPGFRWVRSDQRDELLASDGVMGGAVYPMNPASCLAALLLDPQPGEEILDLAAAPGGKTIVMAGLMANSGRIAAVESVKGRFYRMRANLDRCGVRNVQSYLADGRRVGRKVPERFDRVLLDAPCSSEARVRLDDPASYRHWVPRKIREVARKQKGLVRSAYAALKPGGRLLYCTCAFAPEENEGIIHHLLTVEPEARVLPLAQTLAGRLPGDDAAGTPDRRWRSGLCSWQSMTFDPRVAGAIRILPDDLWDGFFLCLISRGAVAGC